jgi:hypothetical protein
MANPNQAQGNPQDERDKRNQSAKPGAQQNQQNPDRKPQMGGDRGKVGQDTDGDGKVVKPGQTPGQSHGKGLDNSGKPNAGKSPAK